MQRVAAWSTCRRQNGDRYKQIRTNKQRRRHKYRKSEKSYARHNFMILNWCMDVAFRVLAHAIYVSPVCFEPKTEYNDNGASNGGNNHA